MWKIVNKLYRYFYYLLIMCKYYSTGVAVANSCGVYACLHVVY